MSTFQSIVIIQVPSISRRTRWCTPRWSKFQSSITFYMNKLQIRTSELNMLAQKNIQVEYVGTKEQIADTSTKSLPKEGFEYLRQKLNIVSAPQWILNAILICLRFTRRNTIKRAVSFGGAGSGRVHSGGETPRTNQLGGVALTKSHLCHWCEKGRDLSGA